MQASFIEETASNVLFVTYNEKQILLPGSVRPLMVPTTLQTDLLTRPILTFKVTRLLLD